VRRISQALCIDCHIMSAIWGMGQALHTSYFVLSVIYGLSIWEWGEGYGSITLTQINNPVKTKQNKTTTSQYHSPHPSNQHYQSRTEQDNHIAISLQNRYFANLPSDHPMRFFIVLICQPEKHKQETFSAGSIFI